MTTRSQIETVRAFLACVDEGRWSDAATEFLTDDVVVDEPNCLPYGGTWRGHDGWESFGAALWEAWADWTNGQLDLADGSNFVAMRNTFTARARQTGMIVTSSLTEIFRFHEGRICMFDVFYKNEREICLALRGEEL